MTTLLAPLLVTASACSPDLARHVALSAQSRAYVGADLLHVWARDRRGTGIASITFSAEWPGGSIEGEVRIDGRGWGTGAFVASVPDIRRLTLRPVSVRWRDGRTARRCAVDSATGRARRPMAPTPEN